MLTLAEIATPDHVRTWWMVASLLSAVAGGVVGGVTGAFAMGWRMGSWRQATDDRIAALDEKVNQHQVRLERGNTTIDQVPVLRNEMKHLCAQLDQANKTFGQFVTRRECALRHGEVPNARAQ